MLKADIDVGRSREVIPRSFYASRGLLEVTAPSLSNLIYGEGEFLHLSLCPNPQKLEFLRIWAFSLLLELKID